MKKALRSAAALMAAAALALSSAPAAARADNPLVQTSYTSDPAPLVYDGVFYMYTGHDADGAKDYVMPDWKCFSSTDMQNWTDHGTILPESTFEWAGENSAWAAQCIERDGKFYMYVTVVPKNGGGRAIGVAVADSPIGPFKDALGKPLCGPDWAFIDPTVFIDNDGQAYLYFGNPNPYYVKLNKDMISYSGSVTKVDMTPEGFGSKADGSRMYVEGPWFYRRGDLYYLLYAANGIPENIAYSTAPGPTGPWTYRGVIMPSEGRSFTNHCGIVDYEGHSYFAYHNGDLPGGNGFQRSVCVEEFTYNADGTIPTIKMSKSGPAQLRPLDPFQKTEAECFCWEEGIETESCSNGGLNIANIENGDYVKIKGVDFGDGADTFTASVASATSGGKIELRIDKADGELIGTCDVPGTDGWQSWQEVSTQVEVSGQHDLYMKFTGESGFLFNVDWWKFSGAGAPVLEEGVLFHSTFERSLDSWSGRGGVSVERSADAFEKGEKSAFVSGRTGAWQGIIRKLSNDFLPGESYSFSAMAMSPEEDTKFHLTLQYTLGEDVIYKKIDSSIAPAGQWVQLCGNDFRLPEDAQDMYVYVETDEGDEDFYADELIGAVSGTDLAEPELIYALPGDVDQNGRISVFDLICAKEGYTEGFSSPRRSKSADTDGNGEVVLNDLVLLQRYLLGSISAFPDSMN